MSRINKVKIGDVTFTRWQDYSSRQATKVWRGGMIIAALTPKGNVAIGGINIFDRPSVTARASAAFAAYKLGAMTADNCQKIHQEKYNQELKNDMDDALYNFDTAGVKLSKSQGRKLHEYFRKKNQANK